MEFIDGVQLTNYVDHPLPQKGGVMLVGPPETFRTSIVDLALKPYRDALVLSDINVQTLSNMKSDFNRERIRTLAFREFSKLFERDPRTANHLLGVLRALGGEGYTTPPGRDPRMASTPAYALIISCMTEAFYANNFKRWEEDGFARRFIWLTYNVKGTYKATDRLLAKQLYPFDGIPRRYPGHREIPFAIRKEEKEKLKTMMKEQRGETLPILLLAKVLSALRWKYDGKDATKKSWSIIEAVAPCFTIRGGTLLL